MSMSTVLSAKKAFRILFLCSGKITEAEIMAAFQQLNQEVTPFDLNKYRIGPNSVETLSQDLIKKKNEIDFIFMLNGDAFDGDGKMAERLIEHKIPVVSWEVDHPFVLDVFGKRKLIPSPYLTLFCWDEGYMDDFRERGFHAVHYLPNATSAEHFAPDCHESPTLSRYQSRVQDQITFVGCSYLKFVQSLMPKDSQWDLFPTKAHMSILNDIVNALLQETQSTFKQIFAKLNRDYRLTFENAEKEEQYLALSECMVSSRYRIEMLKRLDKLLVYGDKEEWQHDLNENRLMGPVSYAQETKYVFRYSNININIASAKNRLDSNVRLYDVPMAGGFLLTDAKKNIGQQFELDREVIVYHNPDELQEKIARYKTDDAEKQKIVEQAQSRIMNEHLYRHRIETMLSTLVSY